MTAVNLTESCLALEARVPQTFLPADRGISPISRRHDDLRSVEKEKSVKEHFQNPHFK